MLDINWNPDQKELKKFGISMAVICLPISGMLYLNSYSYASIALLSFGLITGCLGTLGSSLCLPLYKFWMMISFVLGFIISPVVFFIVYFVFISPYAMLIRLFGRDRLLLKKNKMETYWKTIDPILDKKRYLKQF